VHAISGVDPYTMGEVMARIAFRHAQEACGSMRTESSPSLEPTELPPVILKKNRALAESIVNSWELVRAFPELTVFR
jgi:hypothetical protein